MVNTKIIIRKDDTDDGFTLENESIISAHINRPCDPSLSELAIGTLEAVLRVSGFAELFCPSDYPDGMESADGQTTFCRDADASALELMQYGYDVLVYTNDLLVGTFYVKSVTRTGAGEYTLNAQNWAGVMDDFTEHGIYYSGVKDAYYIFHDMIYAAPGPKWLCHKIGDRLVQDELLDSVEIRDMHYQKDTVRNQVQQVMFAYGITIREEPAGTLYITTFSSAPLKRIPDDLLYNAGDVAMPEQPHTITLKEYTFSVNPDNSDSAWELLFDNTEFGLPDDENTITWYGLPMSHIRVDSTVYLTPMRYKFTVNGAHKVYGKRYLAASRDVIEENTNVSTGADISIDSYLINPLNSSAVMRRLKAFYFTDRKEIRQDFVWNEEVPGSAYDLTDSFRDNNSGIMGDCTIDLSAMSKTSAVFHANWEPFSPRPFSNTVVLTGSGSWELPEGVDVIQVTLVGGGSGGSSGLKGQDGKKMPKHYTGDYVDTEGGDGGDPGDPGKIRTVTIYGPAKKYSYSCGNGGAGGAVCSSTSKRNLGQPGGDTTFGGYSSAYGNVINTGVKNLINKNVYGAKLNTNGVGDTAIYGGGTWGWKAWVFGYRKYENGISKIVSVPTAENSHYEDSWYMSTDLIASGPGFFFPGGPGGSAVHAKGGNGTPSYSPRNVARSDIPWLLTLGVYLGSGGNGATPTVPGLMPLDTGKPLYGWGGGGGYGGGAGGNSGYLEAEYNGFDKYMTQGNPGRGGNGGRGGDGAPGCVIIYY